MNNPYLIQTLIFIVWMGSAFWYINKRPINFRKYHKWKHLRISNCVPITEIEDKIRMLYRTRLFIYTGKRGNLLYFRDAPTLFSWGNTYIVNIEDESQLILYYRGSMLSWRVDQSNLQSVLFYLGGEPEA